MAEYANSQVLVGHEWLMEHLDDPKVAIVEVDVDTKAYDEGHIPGAVGWNWTTQLADRDRRDILTLADMEHLLGASGISNGTTIILYGDHDNWFAAWAFWQLKIYGHSDARILNGGRKKWIAEGGPLVKDAVAPEPVTYKSTALNLELRAFLPQVKTAAKGRGSALVDVRTPEEFTGKVLSPPGLPET